MPGRPALHCVAAFGAARPDPRPPDHANAAMGAVLDQPRKDFIMANIGTFTAQNNSYAGTVRTLTLNVKVKLVPSDKGSENAPDFRIVAGNGLDYVEPVVMRSGRWR